MIKYYLHIIALLCLGLLPTSAQACSPVPLTFEQQMEMAEHVFIGTVSEADANSATFRIEKALKNSKEGDSFTTDIMHNTCGLVFTKGQSWLFMGASSTSGSFLLRGEQARLNVRNAAFVENKLKLSLPATTASGLLKASCAPWDGAAFTLTLEGGLEATVYKSLSTIPDETAGQEPLVIAADHAMPGHGRIRMCETGAREACVEKHGTLSLRRTSPEKVQGTLHWKEDGADFALPFQADISPEPAKCR